MKYQILSGPLACSFCVLMTILSSCSTTNSVTDHTEDLVPPEKNSLTTAIEITERFVDFLERPEVENYKELNTLIAENDYYFRDTCSFSEVENLLQQKKPDEVISLVDGPDCLAFITTPRHHFYLGAAYRQKGMSEEADSNRSVGFLLAEVIGESGDGSKENPYHVLSVPAEYDFVRIAFDAKRLSQSSLTGEGKQLDRMELSDSRTIFFDTTLHWKMLNKELSRKRK